MGQRVDIQRFLQANFYKSSSPPMRIEELIITLFTTLYITSFWLEGLDPAGPNFNDYPELCLSSSDARFVDIIHTDQGYYGINLNRGTVDFFPNGGYRLQPGCQRALYIYPYDICSHKRCCEIYAESVNNELAFLGVECSSWDNFLSGECNNNTQVIMGYGTPNTASGTVYFKTAAESPFGLGEEGV
ncbi:phospholipase A1 member A-like [Harpegnathos saltator]|uniref:phospholipase A1 member A-like n=1 Tax=Harpegnathos saltator TaxID=610380 RepID=UPI000DBED1F5|nr:phospholipase A1 member A-like [Harpegnathos saltator]